MENEMELLERFAEGDLEAFEALFREFQGEVYRWIVRVIRDPAMAEDLTIETFWRIYRARMRFDSNRSFGAWARRIAMNVSYDYLKKMRPEERFAVFPSERVSADPAVQHDLARRIQHAFSRLPLKSQTVLTLALVEERNYDEIAEALGIPVGTVKSRVFRSVRLLRTQLQRLGVEP
jgi:RNA polymerase sigma-70 factor (ECF subfamily)